MEMRECEVKRTRSHVEVLSTTQGEEDTVVLDDMFKLPEEIREGIFKLLPVPDLLNCRLICKLWKMETSSMLKKHKKCYLIMKRPCKDVVSFFGRPKQEDSFDMINGLMILGCDEDCKRKDTTSRPVGNSPWLNHLGLYGFKYLSIDGITNQCGFFGSLQALLRQTYGTVIELDLDFSKSAELISSCLEDEEVTWPLLQRVVAGPTFNFKEKLQLLNTAAPKLRDIEHGSAFQWEWGRCYEEMANKFSVINVMTGNPSKIKSDLERFARKGRYLRTIENFSVWDKGWGDYLIAIMYGSQFSLRTLAACPMLLAEATRNYKANFTLPRVNELSLCLPHEEDVCMEVLSRINFGLLFPALQQIRLQFDCLCVDSDLLAGIYRCVKVIGTDGLVPCPARSIEYWLGEDQPDQMFQYMNQAFPKIVELRIPCEDMRCEFFAVFPTLESLHIIDCGRAPGVGDGFIDAVFCGIRMEEAQYLQELLSSNEPLPSESLKQLCVVPIQPALRDLKNLHWLKIETPLPTSESETHLRLISKVSEVLAFSWLPKLNVCLRRGRFSD